ncbi:DUF3618 domain-containing protein [Gemmatimonas sp.]|uniref:DUF3618 domain-containing protein n=1 Tax=Gemmatimonas sp. TaxID=1962908 RepID=UPI003983162D
MTSDASWTDDVASLRVDRSVNRPDDHVDAASVSADTSAIRAEIEETRERMSHTLGEIGERLNPRVLKENVKESIREATIGRVSQMAQHAADTVSRSTSGITDTIRENPIPAAMVAIGLGWLLMNRRRPDDNGREVSSIRADARSGEMRRSAMSAGYGAVQYGLEDGSEGTIDRVRERAHHLGDVARDRAHELSDVARERAGQLADRTRETAESVKQRAQDLAGGVAHATRRSAGRVEDAFYENPLALGAVAVAIGLSTGFAAPATDREVRLMGDARDEVVDRVKDLAEETKGKAQHVVARVVQETKTAAREEGLTG